MQQGGKHSKMYPYSKQNFWNKKEKQIILPLSKQFQNLINKS